MEKAHIALSQWLSADTLFMATGVDTTITHIDETHAEHHPVHLLAEQRALLSEANIKELRSRMAPKLFVEAGLQKIGPRAGYYAWQAGVSIPMNFGAHKSTMKAARIAQQQVQAENEDLERQHSTKHLLLLADLNKYRQSTDYYVRTALPLAGAAACRARLLPGKEHWVSRLYSGCRPGAQGRDGVCGDADATLANQI